MNPVRRNTCARMIAFGALLGSAALPALATNLTAQFTSVSPSSTVQRSLNSGVNYSTLTVGLFNLVPTGGTYAGDLNPVGPAIFAFCVEPLEGVSPGSTYTWEVSPLESGATNIGGMGAARADRIRELFGEAYPLFGGPLDAMQASALQIAIWEIVREQNATLSVTGGTTRFQNESLAGTLALAQSYLDLVDGNGPRLQNLLALTLVGNQDLLVQSPEPGTIWLLSLAGACLGFTRRRRA
ncbi:MAG: PEP-CTERM sorting domain-containing protein [Bryobacteraceae bacterium]